MKTQILLILFWMAASVAAFGQWLPTPAPAGPVTSMVAFDNAVVAAVTGSMVIRSADHGATWIPSHAGLGTGTVECLFPVAGTPTIYASSRDSIYKSTDYGMNWSYLPGSDAVGNLLYIHCHDGAIFAVSWDGPNFGLNRSTDEGATWQHLSSGLTSNGVMCMAHDDQYLYAGLVGTGPGSTPGLFRSANNGDTWEPANSGMANDVNRLAVNGARLYIASYSMVWYSTDRGSTWTATTGLFTGMPVRPFLAMGDWMLTAQVNMPDKLQNNSLTWETWTDTLFADVINCFAADLTWVYCGTGLNGIWRREAEQLTGLKDPVPADEGWIRITPNPVDREAVISVTGDGKSPVRVTICNISGKQVAVVEIQAAIGLSATPFDVSALAPGLYGYTAIAGSRHASGKIVVR